MLTPSTRSTAAEKSANSNDVQPAAADANEASSVPDPLDWLSVHGSVSVAGHNEGVLASLGVDAKYHATQRLTLSIGPEVSWVNNQYAMTFFGLDAAQSTIAGIAPYRARSGINSVGVSAGASYMLTDHWSLAAHASYGRLQGDAANSPVTTDKTQRVYGGFIMYRF
jgi:outer membrane protein